MRTFRYGGRIGKRGIEAVFERWDIRETEENALYLWFDGYDVDMLHDLALLIPTPIYCPN